jgi:hypothetical protein
VTATPNDKSNNEFRVEVNGAGRRGSGGGILLGVARLLARNGNLICRLEAIEFTGATDESGTPFSAIVPDDAGVVIRRGEVLVEVDDGTHYPGEIDHAEVVPDPLGPVVKVTGVLGPTKVGT